MLQCDSAELPELADLVRLPVVGSSVARVQWLALPTLVGVRSVVDRPVHPLDDVLLDLQGMAPLLQAALDDGVLWLVRSAMHMLVCIPARSAELGDAIARALAGTKAAA